VPLLEEFILQYYRPHDLTAIMRYAFATFLLAGLAAGDCAADNCLRALRATQTPGRLQSAQSFCATFTKQSVPATAIPTYAADACKQNQNGPLSMRLSSACACIATSTSSTTSTPTATDGACAIVSKSAAAQRAVSPSGLSKRSRDFSTVDHFQLLQLWLLNWLMTV